MAINTKTQYQPIKVNGRIVARFFCHSDDLTIKPFLRDFKKSYQRLVNFFGCQPPEIQVHFIYTRAEMDKHWGGRSARRLCGMVDNKNPRLIYVFSPLVFEKLTIYKKETINSLIIHESAHVFVTSINQKCFAWMNEGVCQYVENTRQHYGKIKKHDWNWYKKNNILYDSQINWESQISHGGYEISRNLVKYIMETKGKKSFFRLLKIARQGDVLKIKKAISTVIGDPDVLLVKFEKHLKLLA